MKGRFPATLFVLLQWAWVLGQRKCSRVCESEQEPAEGSGGIPFMSQSRGGGGGTESRQVGGPEPRPHAGPPVAVAGRVQNRHRPGQRGARRCQSPHPPPPPAIPARWTGTPLRVAGAQALAGLGAAPALHTLRPGPAAAPGPAPAPPVHRAWEIKRKGEQPRFLERSQPLRGYGTCSTRHPWGLLKRSLGARHFLRDFFSKIYSIF